MSELEREVEVVTELSRKAIFDNARTAQNQAEWSERQNGYMQRIQTAHRRLEELAAEKRNRQHKSRILGTYIRNLEASPQALDTFDDKLWMTSIDRVMVMPDGKLVFRFMDGTETQG